MLEQVGLHKPILQRVRQQQQHLVAKLGKCLADLHYLDAIGSVRGDLG